MELIRPRVQERRRMHKQPQALERQFGFLRSKRVRLMSGGTLLATAQIRC